MRHSLLNFLCCPETGEEFVLFAFREVASGIDPRYLNAAHRVTSEGETFGPMPEGFTAATEFSRALEASAPPRRVAAAARNFQVDVAEGMLVSAGTGRWYPIIDGLPELLPDHLRDWKRDLAFLDAARERLPAAVFSALHRGGGAKPMGEGEQYKVAEIELLAKVEKLDDFLGPGYVAPFYIGAYQHSVDLIRGFANALTFLGTGEGKVLLDSGCGYAWTTEWLMKIGVTAIGVDINRTYMDVGRKRMGQMQPHLIVGDVENLPLKNGCLHAILGFDAFHHVPDRPAAMKGFYDKLADGGRVVFVEPGPDHKDTPQSIEVMAKYGTLEHGMGYDDVCEYVVGTGFQQPEELFLNVVSNRTSRASYSKEQLFDSSFIGWRIFVIEKPITGMWVQWSSTRKGLRAWAKRQPLIYWAYRKLRRWFL